jgi:hypothetical protein
MHSRVLAVATVSAFILVTAVGHDAAADATVAAHATAAGDSMAEGASRPAGTPAPSPASPAGSDPDTTVTFSVNVGALSITAPASVDLGSGNPGTTIGPSAVGAITVTDNRAALNATWTAQASSADFTTGGGTGNETIPASDVTYDPGTPTTTGTVTVTPSTVTLSGTLQTVVAATGIVGNNTATWNPSLTVAVPATAVGGSYTGTLTDSVS